MNNEQSGKLKRLNRSDIVKMLYNEYKKYRNALELKQQLHVVVGDGQLHVHVWIDKTSIYNMFLPWYRIYLLLRKNKLTNVKLNKKPFFKIWDSLNEYYESLRHPDKKIMPILKNMKLEELRIMDCWFYYDIIPLLQPEWNEICSKQEMFIFGNFEKSICELYEQWRKKIDSELWIE